MIAGLHVLLPSPDAVADRAFLRDVLRWPFVDDVATEPGWLIFAAPPTEVGVHPGGDSEGAELFLMTDDLDGALAELAQVGVHPIDTPRRQVYGLVARIALPSGLVMGLYEPTHPTPVPDLEAVVASAQRRAGAGPAEHRRAPVRPGSGTVTEHAGLRHSLSTTVLESRDANAHAEFYRRLLGWRTTAEEPGWVMLRPPAGGSGLGFITDPLYEPPVWPATPGRQQMQDHLDIWVDDLERAVEHALACGARLAEHQPQDDVRVLVDPAGHLFCHFED